MRNFVETTLEGSLSPFLAYLTQEVESIKDADLDELKHLIDALEQNRGK